jgi:hypothetical protein
MGFANTGAVEPNTAAGESVGTAEESIVDAELGAPGETSAGDLFEVTVLVLSKPTEDPFRPKPRGKGHWLAICSLMLFETPIPMPETEIECRGDFPTIPNEDVFSPKGLTRGKSAHDVPDQKVDRPIDVSIPPSKLPCVRLDAPGEKSDGAWMDSFLRNPDAAWQRLAFLASSSARLGEIPAGADQFGAASPTCVVLARIPKNLVSNTEPSVDFRVV